jgi:peptidyl-prolyl cis-trans isomerase C
MRTISKRRMGLFIATLLLIVLTSFSALCTDMKLKKLSEEIIASVNGKAITKMDFERQVLLAKQKLLQQGQLLDQAQMESLRVKVLENLIDSELLYQESQSRGIKVENGKINEQFETVKNKFSSDEEFKSALEGMDYTENSLKEDIRRNMAIQDFIESEISQNIVISDDESLDFYDNHPEYFTQPEQVQASHILITVDDPSDASQKSEAIIKIKEIKQKINAGEDFAVLAMEYSQCPSSAKGGDLGFFQRGQMVKPFEDAAFALQPGEISDIIETRFGYHLIKVTDRKTEVVVPYEYMKKSIIQYIKQNKVLNEVGMFLEKARAKATIEKFTPVNEGNQD